MTQNLIEQLHLKPLQPEGGYFRRTYLSDKVITINNETRSIGSSIYYYLDSDDFSAWHRVQCDEIWHFYKGSDVSLHLIDEAGQLQCVCIGDIRNGDHVVAQHIIPAGTWFAAEVVSENGFSLLGCTCFPGYDDRDFELADREKLTVEFPHLKDIIHRLTRD